ncbi:MAG: hypothetical protein U0441_30390 [Polyangiaceae bacterium]
MRSLVSACAFAAGLVGAEGAARAADFEVQAETAAQAYQVTSPWGDLVLDRRRLMQTIGLSVYSLQGKYEPGKPDYSMTLRLRVNADFGLNQQHVGEPIGSETSFDASGRRYVPGMEEVPLDLMYGYVEGRNMMHGWLGFRLGRQYVTDMLGWWSFDGGLVRLTTPFYVQAEFYGGLEQRNGFVLSTGRFERNGIWRGGHEGFGTATGPSLTDYPSFQSATPAPAFGAALESAGPTWLHGRLSYRRVYNTGTSITQQFANPAAAGTDGGFKAINGDRISSDRIGYAADVSLLSGAPVRAPIGAKGGFSYDLYANTVNTWFGGIEAYIGQTATIGLDADYYLPTFDADSIWNWFTHGANTTYSARAAFRIGRRFDFALSGGARTWTTDGDPSTFGVGECKAISTTVISNCVPGTSYIDPAGSVKALRDYVRDPANRGTTTVTDALGNAAARYRIGNGQIGLRGMVQAGDRGHRAGGDLYADQGFVGGKFQLGARVSLYDWDDPMRPERGATSFGYVLGAGFKPGNVADLRVEWEHDMNRLVGQRFRIIGLLNLWVLK